MKNDKTADVIIANCVARLNDKVISLLSLFIEVVKFQL